MRTVKILLCVVAMSHVLTAQSRPNFAGTWTFDPAKSREANGAAPGAPSGGALSAGPAGNTISSSGTGQSSTLEITQTATLLTVNRKVGDMIRTTTYKLDGSETVSTYQTTALRMKSRWEKGALVSEGTQTVTVDGEDRTSTLKEVRSIDPAGNLRVETTRTTPRGSNTSVAIYTRGKGAAR